ncbi:transposase [bacterium]|nr:transposase [bacterium]
MQRYKLIPEKRPFYFCTCTVVEWQCIFTQEKYFKVIVDSINYCRENKGLYLYGMVIMLNHFHMIVSTREGVVLSNVIRDFKRHTSTKTGEMLIADNKKNILYHLQKAAEKQKSKIKIWQDEYHPVALYSRKWLNEKMNYIHYNPVRKGYVLNPEDWKYSSARYWLNGHDEIIQLDL